ncbi:hypothetical protein MRX96_050168 [Rhipicephalus microplus]
MMTWQQGQPTTETLIAVVFPGVRGVQWLTIGVDSGACCIQRLAGVPRRPTGYFFAPGTLPRGIGHPWPFKKTAATPPSITWQQGQPTTETLIAVVFPGVRGVQWLTIGVDSGACCIQRLAGVPRRPTGYFFAPGTIPRGIGHPWPFKKTAATPPSITWQQGQPTTETLIAVVFPG